MYLVVENGFEYNDEINVRVDGYQVKNLFELKEKANEKCKELSLKALRGWANHPGYFTYGEWDEISSKDIEQVVSKLIELFPDEDFSTFEEDWSCWQIPENATDEQLETVLELFDRLKFYEVLEIKPE